MSATVTHERVVAEQNRELGIWAIFKGRNLIRFIIASWPKIVQQFVGLSVFNTYATYFCKQKPWVDIYPYADNLQVQYAGNKNPFLVTVILSSVQLLSMLVTTATTDKFGRRPLTVYPYAVTVISVLCLGIIGCFDFESSALSSLLVSLDQSTAPANQAHYSRSSLPAWPPSQRQVHRRLDTPTLRRSLSNVFALRQPDGLLHSQISGPFCSVSVLR